MALTLAIGFSVHQVSIKQARLSPRKSTLLGNCSDNRTRSSELESLTEAVQQTCTLCLQVWSTRFGFISLGSLTVLRLLCLLDYFLVRYMCMHVVLL